MDSIVRAAVVYLVLLLVFRVVGRRTLAEMGSFDFVLLLVISETLQEALSDQDHSMTNSLLLLLTFVAMNVGFSLLKLRSPAADKILDGVPLVLVEDGKPLAACMTKARVTEEDVLAAARAGHGIGTMAQVRYAVLETTGGITIIPAETGGASEGGGARA